jgi:hypothetical protein
MGSVEDYHKLMRAEREGTSAQFPPTVVSAGEPTVRITEDKPMTDADEAEVKRLAEEIDTRGKLQHYQDQGEILGYSPEPITQTLGDILYTGAATGRHLMGEEGAGEDALMGVGFMALPFSGLMIKSMSDSLKKAANSMRGMSADTLRDNLATIDKHVTDRLDTIDFDLRSGAITESEALIRRGEVEGRLNDAISKAERLFTDSRLGVKSDLTRKLEHAEMNKARVARGEAPIPYKPAPAYGTGGMKEGPMSQPFMGGGIRAGAGRKSARVKTVEDEMRESRQIVDPSNTRLPTAAEKQQLDELGEIVTRDPKAPNTAIVDDSGNVLVGKPGTKAAKDAPDPYPEGTGDVISRSPLEKEYTKGVGKGTVGMSDSLVHSLSVLAKKEFPAHFDERRLVVDPSKYFDALTPAQQKQVLDKAKIQPGLSRDIARYEQEVSDAAKRSSGPTKRNVPPEDVRQALSAKRKERLARESAGTSVKKTGPSQFNDDEIAYLSSISDVAERDKAREMLIAMRKQGTTVTRDESGEFVFKSESKAPKKAKPTEDPKPKSNVQTYEDWKAQKKSKPAEKPKDLPRLKKK